MTYINSNLLPAKDATFEDSSGTSWGAGTNTTVARSNASPTLSGFYLRLTATAAGSVTASPARVAITAGTQYAFYAPIRTNSGTSGCSLTLTITWYNAATGGSTVGTAASLTKTLPNTAGWDSSNYYSVFGTAPSGATHAAVSVSVSNIAAAGTVCVDSVYFCEYDQAAGQLLSPNESSFEQDTAGWTATGATLTRAAGTAGDGYYCLQSTATATTVTAESATYVAATPGTHLAGEVYFYCPNAATTVNLGVRWYDSTHTALSTNTVPASIPQGGSVFTKAVFFATAPASTAYVRVLVTYTDVVGNAVYIDNAVLRTDTVSAGNLLTYAQSTFEDAFPAWTVAHGSVSQVPLQLTTIPSARSARLVSDGSGQLITASQDALVPVTSGQTYRFSGIFSRHITANESVPMSMRLRIDWYDSSSTLLAVGGTVPFVTLTSSQTIELWDVNVEDIPPAGAAYARLVVEIDPTSSALIDAWYMDLLSLAADDPDESVEVDSDNGLIRLQIRWPDDAQHPRTGTLRIRRIEQDGSAHPVRTIWGESTALTYADTGTPVVVEDYEAPLAMTVWYLIEWFDSTGAPAHTLSTEYTRGPVTDGDHVWMKSPGLPARNTMLVPESPLSWSRSSREAAYRVVGRTNPIVISDVRDGRTATANFLVLDTAEHIQLDALLDSGLPVLFQAMPGLGADGNHYFTVGDASVEPLSPSAAEPGWRWTLALTEVDRPSGGLQGSAGTTWQDIADGYTNWLAVFDGFSSWADVLTS